MHSRDLTEFLGKTMSSVVRGYDVITFTTTCGETYVMEHRQSCCESVDIEDIAGDLDDLVGSPIVSAYESTSSDQDNPPPDGQNPDSYTWTFYNISTAKGSVWIRWFGSSNGCYSESVDITRMDSN